MKIYLDLVFFMNFFIDCLVLFTVNKILKRNKSIKKIILGGLIGSISTLFVFVPLNNMQLFILKLSLSTIMVLSCFSYYSLKETLINVLYLYFVSIILGGALYYINLELTYSIGKNNLLTNNFYLNTIALIVISPVILYFYIKQNNHLKNRTKTIYNILLIEGTKKYQYTGYLDTGNKLIDPYTKGLVHILYDPNYKLSKKQKVIYVPYVGLQNTGIIPCVYFDKMIIDNDKVFDKVLIGLSKQSFKLDGIDVILNSELLSSTFF